MGEKEYWNVYYGSPRSPNYECRHPIPLSTKAVGETRGLRLRDIVGIRGRYCLTEIYNSITMLACRRGLFTYLRKSFPRTVSNESQRQKHTLPDLPYDYNALEPVISADIMKLHHSKHHATYIANLNVAEEKLKEAEAKGDVSTIISLAPALKFNGGGHINHTIFWQNLSPTGGDPSPDLLAAIKKDFGSLDKLKAQLSAASIGVQGSGWGWLGFNKTTNRLQIATCANQDPLQATTGLVPLFGIDVWEHAYYLQYKNVRADYVKAIFDIANWDDISKRFQEAAC